MSRDDFGLSDEELEQIVHVLQAFPNVKKGIIFGSRAKGTFKKGSDIDIALLGTNLNEVPTKVAYILNEELLLPYFFDIIDYDAIATPELKEHIDRLGRQFYKNC